MMDCFSTPDKNWSARPASQDENGTENRAQEKRPQEPEPKACAALM